MVSEYVKNNCIGYTRYARNYDVVAFVIYPCAEFGAEWKEMYDSPSPHEAELPGSWNKIKGLDRLRRTC